jgi:hypothetical protein
VVYDPDAEQFSRDLAAALQADRKAGIREKKSGKEKGKYMYRTDRKINN